ncbi:hypothetical protein HPB51_006717 [Rhipicephalus microplus]|uniref:Metalloprotease n=1 Tax=Rhipicephalus microplus TaxID=6941 RepID=A0A9J6E816_RHIMP|nr:hypothetical protein HPB51_006717 [Rhipicephalus microplus]
MVNKKRSEATNWESRQNGAQSRYRVLLLRRSAGVLQDYYGPRSETPRRVYPRLLEERSSDGRIAMRIHEGLTLNLRRATVAAPKVRVLAEENGRAVTQFYDGEDINKNLYEDEVQLATVEVIKSAKGVSMRGLVGPHHRIQPMPVSERSEEDTIPHMIYKIDADDMLDKTLKTTERSLAKISERAYGRPTPVPDTIYVEVFIVTGKRHIAYYKETTYLIWYACVMVNFLQGANMLGFQWKRLLYEGHVSGDGGFVRAILHGPPK